MSRQPLVAAASHDPESTLPPGHSRTEIDNVFKDKDDNYYSVNPRTGVHTPLPIDDRSLLARGTSGLIELTQHPRIFQGASIAAMAWFMSKIYSDFGKESGSPQAQASNVTDIIKHYETSDSLVVKQAEHLQNGVKNTELFFMMISVGISLSAWGLAAKAVISSLEKNFTHIPSMPSLFSGLGALALVAFTYFTIGIPGVAGDEAFFSFQAVRDKLDNNRTLLPLVNLVFSSMSGALAAGLLTIGGDTVRQSRASVFGSISHSLKSSYAGAWNSYTRTLVSFMPRTAESIKARANKLNEQYQWEKDRSTPPAASAPSYGGGVSE